MEEIEPMPQNYPDASLVSLLPDSAFSEFDREFG